MKVDLHNLPNYRKLHCADRGCWVADGKILVDDRSWRLGATAKWGYFVSFVSFFYSITDVIDSPTMNKFAILVKHNVLKL